MRDHLPNRKMWFFFLMFFVGLLAGFTATLTKDWVAGVSVLGAWFVCWLLIQLVY